MRPTVFSRAKMHQIIEQMMWAWPSCLFNQGKWLHVCVFGFRTVRDKSRSMLDLNEGRDRRKNSGVTTLMYCSHFETWAAAAWTAAVGGPWHV